MIDGWRSFPSVAAEDLLHLPLSEDLDERYTFTPVQRIALNRVWDARSSIVVACRGFGKTRLAATLAILRAWLYPGRRVGCLSASFRQAKQIFEEIDKIWHRSPLLQQCTTRHPIMSNDACKLDFKAIPGYDPSTIRALPLADGAKIRGSRFHTVFIDECVHVPEDVFNLVIRPMSATHQDPMKVVRIEEEKDRIRGLNLPPDEERDRIQDLERFVGANQICMLTSGYFSFNYVFKLWCKYSNRMHGVFDKDYGPELEGGGDDTDDPKDYAAFQIPQQCLPRGFLDRKGVKQAHRDMTRLQFRMEYEAAWITDTGGFFSAEDIEACRAPRLGLKDHHVSSRGVPGRKYILAVDPARKDDAFAMVVFEFDSAFGVKVVHAEQYHHNESYLPKMVRRIFDLANLFDFIRIGIDKGGGGLGVADLLAQDPGDGSLPIYDMGDERYKGLRGRHILKLVDFTSGWIEDAHHNVYSMLQRRQVSFPGKRIDEAEGEHDNDVHFIIEKMINQILSIQVSETRTGKLHFDLPESGGEFEKHKDLYSAFLIGCDIAYNMIQIAAIPRQKMPLFGIVTPRNKFF